MKRLTWMPSLASSRIAARSSSKVSRCASSCPRVTVNGGAPTTRRARVGACAAAGRTASSNSAAGTSTWCAALVARSMTLHAERSPSLERLDRLERRSRSSASPGSAASASSPTRPAPRSAGARSRSGLRGNSRSSDASLRRPALELVRSRVKRAARLGDLAASPARGRDLDVLDRSRTRSSSSCDSFSKYCSWFPSFTR